MRCYLFRRGHIAAVEMLKDGSDETIVGEARALFDKRERDYEGFEVWDCARFVYRYPELPPAYRSARMTGQASYRLYLLGDDGIIRGYFDFAAESDKAAYELAELAFDACSDRATHFELWHDSHLLSLAAPPPMTTTQQVLVSRQAQIVAFEERMRDSRWAIATSERLLARLKDVKAPLVSTDQEPAESNVGPHVVEA